MERKTQYEAGLWAVRLALVILTLVEQISFSSMPMFGGKGTGGLPGFFAPVASDLTQGNYQQEFRRAGRTCRKLGRLLELLS